MATGQRAAARRAQRAADEGGQECGRCDRVRPITGEAEPQLETVSSDNVESRFAHMREAAFDVVAGDRLKLRLGFTRDGTYPITPTALLAAFICRPLGAASGRTLAGGHARGEWGERWAPFEPKRVRARAG
ncbi:hypothetical protein BU225_20690, partial [Stenotrophomonas sp. MB339]